MSYSTINLDLILSKAVFTETRVALRAPSVAVLLCILRQQVLLLVRGSAGGSEGATVGFEKKGRHLTYIRGSVRFAALHTGLLKARNVCALGLGQRCGGDHSDKGCSGEEVAEIHFEDLCECLRGFENGSEWYFV